MAATTTAATAAAAAAAPQLLLMLLLLLILLRLAPPHPSPRPPTPTPPHILLHHLGCHYDLLFSSCPLSRSIRALKAKLAAALGIEVHGLGCLISGST